MELWGPVAIWWDILYRRKLVSNRRAGPNPLHNFIPLVAGELSAAPL